MFMSDGKAGDRRLARLVRNGLVRPGRATALPALLAAQPPRADRKALALEALIAERREGC